VSAADLVTRLAQAGVDPALLADVAQELFASEIERKALANRRQGERERKARSRDGTGRHGKSREGRGPPKEYISNPLCSEANASGASPPADPVKQVFDLGVAVLTETGIAEKQARSLVGKWCKGGKEAEVLQALLIARQKANPVEWLNARFKTAKWVSASGYEYRGSDEQILREAERRNDMTTYWALKSQLKQRAA
jgi:hypothetical protein